MRIREKFSFFFFLVVAGLFGFSTPGFAQTFYLYTGQTGAQTQIDTNHTTSWRITVGSNKTVTLGGAKLTMKHGPQTKTDVSLKLYSGSSAIASNLLATITLTRDTNGTFYQGTNVQTFAQRTFAFPSSQVLTSGTYFITLTSTSDDQQNEAFFIKGEKTAFVSSDGTTVASGTSTVFASPSFTLSKSATSAVGLSGAITYTFNLGNEGGSTTGTSATVKDQLPSGVQATGAAVGTGVTNVSCSPLNQSSALLTCSVALSTGLAAKSANGAAKFTISATAPSSSGTITNYASVDPAGGPNPLSPVPTAQNCIDPPFSAQVRLLKHTP